MLQELDVRLSDVFGADNVLWVEGPTEEICFPLLLKAFGHSISAGTAVVATINPNDLTGKRPRRSLVWEVYERLTVASALIPPALAFSFDREDRTPIEIEDITRRSRGLAHFLPRRTYENYLLDAESISAILNKNGIGSSADSIQLWINQNGKQRKYIVSNSMIEVGDQVWLTSVNAPKLLADIFDDFSKDAPLPYDKLLHSVALTE